MFYEWRLWQKNPCQNQIRFLPGVMLQEDLTISTDFNGSAKNHLFLTSNKLLVSSPTGSAVT
jgi:hypothetical protein